MTTATADALPPEGIPAQVQVIDTNGAWKGFWLMSSRLSRCHPWGTHGYDGVPDLSGIRHPLYAAYRYGRWTGRHL